MDVDQIAALLKLLKENDVTELEYQDQELTLHVRVGHPPVAAQVVHAPVVHAPAPVAAVAPPAAPAAPVPEAGLHVVMSPFVGTFYAAPSPEKPAFVNVGDSVRVGQAMCIIEAMKLMNEIESDVSGVVVAQLVKNGDPVEFGTPLFKIRAA